MSPLNETSLLKQQYRDGTNLDARIALHARFSTATQNFHDWLFDHVDAPTNARVLELGCGTGQLWKTVHARVPRTWRLVLTDLSFGMVSGLDLTGFRNLTGLAQSDAQAIPFADATFDAVIANHMLYHVPHLPRAFAEIRRVLRNGGKLYAATNGAGHMAELREFGDALGIDYSYMAHLSFRLENGAELLSPYFESVSRDDFDNALVVTEAEPLIAYVRSMRAAMHTVSDEQVRQLRAILNERIARDGAIRIRKKTGLFVACK